MFLTWFLGTLISIAIIAFLHGKDIIDDWVMGDYWFIFLLAAMAWPLTLPCGILLGIICGTAYGAYKLAKGKEE